MYKRQVQPIAVIPYPVTPLPARPSTASGPCTIICVARLMPQKGHRDLLHAVAQVIAAGVKVRLLLAGDGPLAGELPALAAELPPAPSTPLPLPTIYPV
mgnify:CR=1 FL=1